MLAVARSVTPPGMSIKWHEASAEAMPLPAKNCNGTAVYGTYLLTEGDDTAFVDDETGRGPINRSEHKSAWHCGTCGHYWIEKPK
jgi:hypothetical protein